MPDNTKNKRRYDIFLSICISICVVIMTRVQFSGSVMGSIDENYFTHFGVSAIFLLIICLIVFYLVIYKLDFVLKEIIYRLSNMKETIEDSHKVLLFWGTLIFAVWLPYYLSYYPGGIYGDTIVSINWALSGTLTNRHPFLYNTLIGLAIKLGDIFGRDLNWSMGVFLAIQMMLLEIEIIYMLRWMIRHHINSKIRTMIMIFMVFFSLFPLYAISVWKDTPFCMAFMFWFMFWTDLYLEVQDNCFNYKTLLGAAIGAILVAFTRNNGIYVIVLAAIAFIFSNYKNKFQGKRKIYGVIALTVFFVVFIQGPVYRWGGVAQTELVENLGVPLQQICSVVAYGGDITEDQIESINHFLPYKNIKEHFAPCLADNIKWYADLDREYLSTHMNEFWNLWICLGLRNPITYTEEYLLETLGFWNVDVSAKTAYIQKDVWENSFGLYQQDFFERWFGFSFQHFVEPRSYLSGAWFFWIFFIGMIFVMKHYGWKNGCLFMPQIGVWLTLMIATPIAISLRYIAPLLFTLPFVVLIPIILEKRDKEFKVNENIDK